MASSRIIEEESGTYYTRPRHPHNGYYAGDFSRNPMRTASELSGLAKLRLPTLPAPSGHADSLLVTIAK